jgi:hypothetical protein
VEQEDPQVEYDHYSNIEDALRSFVPDEESNLLQRVIISGEALNSTKTSTNLRYALLRALPLLPAAKILDSTEPFYLGAVGAAHWSRLLYHNYHMLLSDWGMSHCCFGDPKEEECYWGSQQYLDDIEKRRKKSLNILGFQDPIIMMIIMFI